MKSLHFSWQLVLALVVAVAAWWPATIEIKRSAVVYNLEKKIALHRKGNNQSKYKTSQYEHNQLEK